MSKEFVVVIRKGSTTGPVVAVSSNLTLAAGSGSITSSDFTDNSLSGTIVVNNNLGFFSKIASTVTVPTITSFAISPTAAIESTANIITITYSVSDVVGRVMYWKVTGIGSTATNDFVNDTAGFAYTTPGLRSGLTATLVVNNDAIAESLERYYVDFTLDPALTEGNYFHRAGPFSIQDKPNSVEAYLVATGAATSTYTANTGNLNIVITGSVGSNVTVTGSGLAAGTFPGSSSTYQVTIGNTGTYTFANLNPTTNGTFTYTLDFQYGTPSTATKSITVST